MENLEKSRVLIEVATKLDSETKHAAAFIAALIARIKAAEAVLIDGGRIAIDSSSLAFSSRFLTYPAALEQFTGILSRSFANAGLSKEFAQCIEEITLSDEPLNLEVDQKRTVDPDVFRQLAHRLADDGLASEAGRALGSATLAAWKKSHRDQYGKSWAPLIDQVTDGIIEILGLNPALLGHTEMWEQLQEVRFVPKVTPTAI